MCVCRDEKQTPAGYIAVRQIGMLFQDKGVKGGFIKVCKNPLTRDKRPESELHYATPPLRGLCQDGSTDPFQCASHHNT